MQLQIIGTICSSITSKVYSRQLFFGLPEKQIQEKNSLFFVVSLEETAGRAKRKTGGGRSAQSGPVLQYAWEVPLHHRVGSMSGGTGPGNQIARWRVLGVPKTQWEWVLKVVGDDEETAQDVAEMMGLGLAGKGGKQDPRAKKVFHCWQRVYAKWPLMGDWFRGQVTRVLGAHHYSVLYEDGTYQPCVHGKDLKWFDDGKKVDGRVLLHAPEDEAEAVEMGGHVFWVEEALNDEENCAGHNELGLVRAFCRENDLRMGWAPACGLCASIPRSVSILPVSLRLLLFLVLSRFVRLTLPLGRCLMRSHFPPLILPVSLSFSLGLIPLIVSL